MSRYLAFAVLFGLAALALPASSQADGKELLKTKKCTKCHSLEADGVQKNAKGKKGPDLAGSGLNADAATIAKFLQKEIAVPSVYNKDKKVKHKSKWKGSDEDLKTLSEYLASKKTKVEYKDEGGADDDGDDE